MLAAARGAPWRRRDLFEDRDEEGQRAASRATPGATAGKRRSGAGRRPGLRAGPDVDPRLSRPRASPGRSRSPRLEPREYHPELDPKSYGFTDGDLDRSIFIDNVLGLETATLREIVDVLRPDLRGTIGYEFMHISRAEEKLWIQRRIEGEEYHEKISSSRKRKIMRQLTHAEGFERFLHLKYPGTKRFGLDGAESAIRCWRDPSSGPPRWACGKCSSVCPTGAVSTCSPTSWRSPTPRSSGVSGFRGASRRLAGSGDVKYHLGTSAERIMDDMPVYVSLRPQSVPPGGGGPGGHGAYSRQAVPARATRTARR